jgi:hypothetical protein
MIETYQETYRLAEGVLSVDLEEENILLSVGSGKYFGVKGAMRHLLEGLRDGLSSGEMVALTCDRYDVAREDAVSDLDEMLGKLVAAGIVEQIG